MYIWYNGISYVNKFVSTTDVVIVKTIALIRANFMININIVFNRNEHINRFDEMMILTHILT